MKIASDFNLGRRHALARIRHSLMPRTTEPAVNAALGDLLAAVMAPWSVMTENTQVFAENPRWHPDVLITKPDRSPVVIEAEFDTAANVEHEAQDRLGATVAESGKRVEAAIAVRYPRAFQQASNLPDAFATNDISYCVYPAGDARFPESGWMHGNVADLSDLVRLLSIPQSVVDAAVELMERGISLAEPTLRGVVGDKPGIGAAVAEVLGMEDIVQTRRMACAIIANAMVFHHKLAGTTSEITRLPDLAAHSPAPFRVAERAWMEVLKVNYWPIFGIALDIVRRVPGPESVELLRRLQVTADEVIALGVDNSHDVTGRIFQRLIADRKYLATFYTLPASAALMARLAVGKVQGFDWSDPTAIGELRIADFACGTGALLSAVYEQIATQHERHGGNPSALHKPLLEDVLYGCDVMPSAIHITGSTLSGMDPGVRFDETRLYALAYGRQADNSVAVGSLELLRSSAAMSLFNTSDPAARTGGRGQEMAARITTDIPDLGYDLVIMNPPFTRSTNHEGPHASVVNPAFAAFGAGGDDQTEMGKRLNQLGRGTCYHGNAGLASAFAALAHRKLKPGGVMAMVLPLSATAGLSWSKFRHLLHEEYEDLDIVSIADANNEISFSADSGLGECLIIGKKRNGAMRRANRIRFASLKRRPKSLVESDSIAKQLLQLTKPRGIEDGPFGGTPLVVGATEVGDVISVEVGSRQDLLRAVRMSDFAVAQVAHSLARSMLRLPGIEGEWTIPMAPLKHVGQMGMVHRDIIGPIPRGAFDLGPASDTSTYPALWNHNATQETRILCKPDKQLRVRQGMEQRASETWATAGRVHQNLAFRFNSQPLAAAFTDTRSLGGSAWPNLNFDDARYEHAYCLWANSTLGLITFWWNSNRQQSGRGVVTIRSVEDMPILDLRQLTDSQLHTAREAFEDFRERDLLPAYQADVDPNRELLDRELLCGVLELDVEVFRAVRRLTAKWCAEPSVHGGKSQ